jgi:Phage stabilisation protein
MGGRISLFGAGQRAKSPYVTAKQLTNMYAETRPQGEKSSLTAYQTPGEVLFADMGDTPIRGGIEYEVGNVSDFVHRGTLWEINNAGLTVSRGTLNTAAGRVTIAYIGVQVMIVDGTYGYIYNTSTMVFSQITDPDFPANPVSVTSLGRRFIVCLRGSSRFYVSDLDDGLAWDALNFANAESNPDAIIAVYASNGQLILMGSISCEYWGNSGALDFPFSALQGTATEWGLAAQYSIAKYDNTLAYLVKNRTGQAMLAKLNGYLPERLSTPDFDSIVQTSRMHPPIATCLADIKCM